jgi:hypothetical protein
MLQLNGDERRMPGEEARAGYERITSESRREGGRVERYVL